MQGDAEVIEMLNLGLTNELTAVNQYFIQAKMCQNWGYAKLGAKHYHESIDEMKHAEMLIDRILFLEGTPEIARYNVIRVGSNVKEQLENDLLLETEAVKVYNQTVDLCVKKSDAGSRELVEKLLVGSEEHVDWVEVQLHLIDTVGIENYLAQQMSEGE